MDKEDRIIWSLTSDEVLERWEIWNKWDLVYRIGVLFGGEGDKPKKPVYDNSEEAMRMMDSLFPQSPVN